MKRYTQRPFPPYAYVPGRNPHPVLSKDGYAFGKDEALESIPHEVHGQMEPFLYGLDLFHGEYFWQAHESWEQVWKHLDRKSSEALVLQSLIQLSGACLKHILQNERGVQRLCEKALRTLRSIDRAKEEVLGLKLRALEEAIEGFSKADPQGRAFPEFHLPGEICESTCSE